MDPLSRSPLEELVNSLTHGVGLIFSLAGALILFLSIEPLDPWRVAGCGIFAASLVAVYAASTLSHAVASPKLRHTFRTLDQSCIYLLIVGTYTPFALEYLRFGAWLFFLMLLWMIALVGFCSKMFFAHRINAVTIWSYLLLGWLPILPTNAYFSLVPMGALTWILIGGLCYTCGTLFLILDHRRFQFHAIWHLFVVAGSACHYGAVLTFVASAPQHPS